MTHDQPMQPPSQNHARFLLTFIGAASLVLLYLRAPDIFATPHFWAEDLTEFLLPARDFGLASLWRPYAGYLHAVPRLVSLLAVSLSPHRWLDVFTLAAIAIAVWTALILARTVGRGGILAALAAAGSIFFASGQSEILGTVTNLQWIMATAIIPLAVYPERIGRSERYLFMVLACLSGPFSAAFSPLFAWLFIDRWRKGGAWGLPFLSGVCAGIQLMVIVFHPAPPGGASDPAPLWLAFRLVQLATSDTVYGLVAVGVLALMLAAGSDRSFRIFVACGFLLVIVAVVYKFRTDPMVFETGLVGQRYWYVQATLLLLVCAMLMAEEKPFAKLAGLICYAALLWGSLAQHVERPWPWPSDDWHAAVVKARSEPTIYHFPPNWEVTLDFR